MLLGIYLYNYVIRSFDNNSHDEKLVHSIDYFIWIVRGMDGAVDCTESENGDKNEGLN